MTETKKSISSLEQQREQSMKRIATVWFLQQRISIAMSKSDNVSVQLEGKIEMDDAFVIAIKQKKKGDKNNQPPPKRGRISHRKQLVFVLVESKKKRSGKGMCGNLKMIAEEGKNTPEVNEINDTPLRKRCTVRSDAHPAYRQLSNSFEHIYRVTKPKMAPKLQPWVQIALSTIERLLNGINHIISIRYAHCYLDEVVFKFNN